jgi:hypothetical protein
MHQATTKGMKVVEAEVKALFQRYQRLFEKGLSGDIDAREVAAFYAPVFIAASPAGIFTGKNNAALLKVMREGYARYRQTGMKSMGLGDIRLSEIDDHHCMAHVGWTASYARRSQADVTIEFEVHYLLQNLDGEPKIFGWVSGDEQELLRQHGIVPDTPDKSG